MSFFVKQTENVIFCQNRQFFNLSLVSIVTHNSRGYGLWVHENPILSHKVHIWLN